VGAILEPRRRERQIEQSLVVLSGMRTLGRFLLVLGLFVWLAVAGWLLWCGLTKPSPPREVAFVTKAGDAVESPSCRGSVFSSGRHLWQICRPPGKRGRLLECTGPSWNVLGGFSSSMAAGRRRGKNLFGSCLSARRRLFPKSGLQVTECHWPLLAGPYLRSIERLKG
jgi:hypothetical protein